MTPKELVPTLETCMLLKKAGYKTETCFSWAEKMIYTKKQRQAESVWFVEFAPFFYRQRFFAPTLQELLENDKFHEINARDVENASLQWLELHKEEV